VKNSLENKTLAGTATQLLGLRKREGEAPAEPELQNDVISAARIGRSLSLPKIAPFAS